MFVLFIATPIYSWNNVGHKIIAFITYQHLKPQVRQRVNQLTEQLDPQYPPLQRFLYDAIWLDILPRGANSQKPYHAWHFIDLPYSRDGSPFVFPSSENLLTSLTKAQQTLQDPKATLQQKAFALRLIVHLAGDAHQPLHCIALFSSHFPHGDAGGNFYLIQAGKINNLHAYWDGGLGLLAFRGRPLSSGRIRFLAQQIVKTYPARSFGSAAADIDFHHWTTQSYELAKDFAYKLPENSRPSWYYNHEGRKIVKRQIALAGYRLAALLNTILTTQGEQ